VESRSLPTYIVRCNRKDTGMAKVEIYTSPICGYCFRAKALLEQKGVDFVEIDVFSDPAKRAEMQARTDGARTVPQIFIGDTGIGGCDELYALEAAGELDPLLSAA
jgi:glutaredoxin 3